MSDCEKAEIRDLLPDYAHGKLSAESLERVEAHIAECGLCAEEWALLRRLGVALSASAPVNVAAIVAALPPSPAKRLRLVASEGGSAGPSAPVRRRVSTQPWLRIAAGIVLVAGVGTLAVARFNRVATSDPVPVAVSPVEPSEVVAVATRPESIAPRAVVGSPELSAGVAGDLSDAELRGLLDEIDQMAAEPAAESEEIVRGLRSTGL